MRRLTVLSLSLQLMFPGTGFVNMREREKSGNTGKTSSRGRLNTVDLLIGVTSFVKK
jgi:hypothetical protein